MDEVLDDVDIFDWFMIKYMISLDNILKLGSNFVFNIEVDELKEVMIFLEFWV